MGRHKAPMTGPYALEELRAKLSAPIHGLTGESVGGFLVVCICGEAVDDYAAHLAEPLGLDPLRQRERAAYAGLLEVDQ